MPGPKPPAFETLSLHAGQHPDPVTGSRAVPIYQTTSYVFQDTEHAAALFNLERAGHIYTRISNPTTAVLEERLAALESGVGAVCTASGMAALHLAIATLLSAGDHIVASASLYGGTINLLTHTLPRFGITTTFVKPRDHAGMRAAVRPNTKLFIAETIGNPGLEVLDIVKRRDANELWDASENLDAACEGCHRSYWYPGENLEYYRRLDRRMRDHNDRLREGQTGARTK